MFNKFQRLILNLLNLSFARALGFEPRSKVLETRMLPLHHARKKSGLSKPPGGGFRRPGLPKPLKRRGFEDPKNLKNF